MDVTSLVLNVDPSGAVTGFGKFTQSAGAAGQSATKMAADTDAASTRATKSIGAFTVAAGELIAGLVKEMALLAIELAKMAWKDVISDGLRYDDMIRKATISIAAFVQGSNPTKFKDFNDAMTVSALVVDQLRQKVIQFHLPMEDLISTFQGVMQSTNDMGLSLRQQISLTTEFANAFRALGISGNMASREIRDILNGMGQRTIGGRALFGNDLKEIDDMTKPLEERLSIITADLQKFEVAGQHGNEVLSYSFEALTSQVTASLGTALQPLYDNLVANVNKVREVVGMLDLTAVYKPLVDILKQAADAAANLAKALIINPSDAWVELKAGLNLAFEESVNFLLKELADPKVSDAFKSVANAFGQTIINLMFDAAAILAATVNQITGTMPQRMKINAEIALDAIGTLAEHDNTAAKLKGQQDEARLDALNVPSTQNIQDSYAAYQKQIPATMAMFHLNPSNSKNGLGSPESLSGAQSDYDAAVKKTNQDTVTKQLAQIDDDLKTALANRGKTSPLDVKPTITNSYNEAADEKDIEQQIKIATGNLQSAKGTGNQAAIDQADEIVQIWQHRLELTKSEQYSLEEIGQMTDEYAENLKKTVALREQEKQTVLDTAAAQKRLQDAQKDVGIISSNPFQTNEQKRPEITAALDKEIQALTLMNQVDQRALANGNLTPDQRLQRQGDIDKNNDSINQANQQKQLQTDAGQFQSSWVKFQDSLGTVGTQTAGLLTGTLSEALNTVSKHIDDVINGTETWGQAFRAIGADIMQTLEQLIVKMLLTMALQAALNAATGGGYGATASAVGSVSSLAGGMHSGGVSGVDSASFYQSMPRFHTGGLASDETPAILRKDETVLTPGQLRQIQGASGGAASMTQGQQAPTIHNHIVNYSNPSDAADYLAKNPGAFVNLVNANKREVRMVLS